MNAATEAAVAPPRSAPVKPTWVCLLVAWVLFLLPIPGVGLFIGWPLNLVAFILAIVVMARGFTSKGLIPLLCSLIASPIIYFIGLAIFGAAVSGSAYEDYKQRSAEAAASASATATAQVEASAVLDVTAADLYAAYEANEVSADQMFKGKQLRVTGTVAGINKSAFDEVYVELDTGEMFNAAHAQDLDPAVAATLAKGMEITVSCTGGGLMIGSPILEDCALQ